MSESDQFRQYAEEALLWAAQSKTEEEKQLLLELVCTWTQAAVVSERTVAGPTIHEPSKDIGSAAGAKRLLRPGEAVDHLARPVTCSPQADSGPEMTM
jgi:hypothetical protein